MTKKIKLNKTQRTVIEEYGVKHIQFTIDRKREAELHQAILDGANKAIRIRYPQEDMVILRKFNLTREDRCLRFQFPSQRVDGFSFKLQTPIADMPYKNGCFSGEVFPVDAAFEEAFDEYATVKRANDKFQNDKWQSFRALAIACVYLDEVLEVIELPEEIRERLGHRSIGLVAVTPETVASLKATFKQAA
jgi:hypothetical protein